MQPERLALERTLRIGETVTLRRRIGTSSTFVDVACRAVVRGYNPRELIGGIAQKDSKVIISPAEIEASGWPGAAGGTTTPRKGDFVVIQGTSRAVEVVGPVYVRGELVRIEMRVIG